VKNGENIYKVLIPIDDMDKLNTIADKIKQLENLEAYRSGKNLLDAMNNKANKGKGVEILANSLGIKKGRSCCFW